MRTRKVQKGRARMSVAGFQKVVGSVVEKLDHEEQAGKHKIITAFSKLSPEDKKEVEDNFMPINASLDISKHVEVGAKLYKFQKMH